jgi:Protein of unknown function (DUF2726)
VAPIYYILIIALGIAALAVWVAWTLYKQNRHLKRRIAGFLRTRAAWTAPTPAPIKTPEQERAEFLQSQLAAVTREQVTFRRRRVMSGGEFSVFRAGMAVTGQPYPTGPLGFWIFPQVALGQIIGTEGAQELAEEAHRAINSKRCDLIIADRNGTPLLVLEYQGSGHNIGGTAVSRDEIKRVALERAGVRFIEIREGATQAEIQHTIRSLLTPAASTPATVKGR